MAAACAVPTQWRRYEALLHRKLGEVRNKAVPYPRTGCRGFSRAYDRLLSERIYRTGTVDAVLQDGAVEVCDVTLRRFTLPPDSGNDDVAILRRKRPLLAHFADSAVRTYLAKCKVTSLALFCRDIETQFPSPEHSALGGYYSSPDDFMWGGVEEFVIAKGSDWCAELARVFCALCEMVGVPARIVFALDGSDDGHVLCECFDDNEWMLVDPLAAKLYQDAHIGRVGAARMHQLTNEVRRVLTASAESYYVHERFFRHLSVSEYSIRDAERYDYGLSRCNEYYRQRLSDSWNEVAARA